MKSNLFENPIIPLMYSISKISSTGNKLKKVAASIVAGAVMVSSCIFSMAAVIAPSNTTPKNGDTVTFTITMPTGAYGFSADVVVSNNLKYQGGEPGGFQSTQDKVILIDGVGSPTAKYTYKVEGKDGEPISFQLINADAYDVNLQPLGVEPTYTISGSIASSTTATQATVAPTQATATQATVAPTTVAPTQAIVAPVTTTVAPTQATASSTSNASPKTSDNNALYIMIGATVVAAAGALIVKKKMSEAK